MLERGRLPKPFSIPSSRVTPSRLFWPVRTVLNVECRIVEVSALVAQAESEGDTERAHFHPAMLQVFKAGG